MLPESVVLSESGRRRARQQQRQRERERERQRERTLLLARPEDRQREVCVRCGCDVIIKKGTNNGRRRRGHGSRSCGEGG